MTIDIKSLIKVDPELVCQGRGKEGQGQGRQAAEQGASGQGCSAGEGAKPQTGAQA